MGFRIETNVAALNAHSQMMLNNTDMNNSLEKLSSGLRINKAADDASGMAIADSLRAHSGTLGESVRNANDAIGILQIADKGMDEQVNILDTIKTKAIQAAQDGQTMETRGALQKDINKLVDELDNIASTTSYNGQSLLSGSFTNKEFQIGGYSNTTVNASISATSSDKIGSTRFETGYIKATKVSAASTALKDVSMTFKNVDGLKDIKLESVSISTSAGTGIGVLAETINKNSNITGVRASWKVEGSGQFAVASGTIKGLHINGVDIGDLKVAHSDEDGTLVNAINTVSDKTGVTAATDSQGRLTLTSTDGRAISLYMVSASDATATLGTSSVVNDTTGATQSNYYSSVATTGGFTFYGSGGSTGTVTAGSWTADSNSNTITIATNVLGGGDFNTASAGDGKDVIVGRLSLTRNAARDINVSGTNISIVGMDKSSTVAQETINLRAIKGGFSECEASAMGANTNAQNRHLFGLEAGVTSLAGAMGTMSIVDSSLRALDEIRSKIGANQNKLASAVNSISVTQTNLKSAESQIRDVDFAKESANFDKTKLLASSGNFALSQANASQKAIMKVLE